MGAAAAAGAPHPALLAARKKFTATALLLALIAGAFFGFSPVIAPLTAAFPANSVYAPAGGLMFFAGLAWFSALMWAWGTAYRTAVGAGARAQDRFLRAAVVGAAWCAPANQLAMAVAVWADAQWVLYVFAAPLIGGLGTSAGAALQLTAWWSLDGRKGTGNALFSGVLGLAAPLYTLVFGGLIGSISGYVAGQADTAPAGLGDALAAVAGVSAALAAAVTGLVLRGWAPSLAGAQAALAAAGEPVPAPPAPSLAAPGPAAPPAAPGGRPPMTLRQMAATADFYLVLVFVFTYSFVGMGCKGLLSYMFETIFQESYANSWLLAALSLVAFVAFRALVPWLSDRIDSFLLVLAAALVDVALFGALQSIIDASGSVAAFTAVKVATGGVFACIQSLLVILPADAFGVHNLPTISRVIYATLGVAMGLGVLTGNIVGAYGVQKSADDGTSTRDAFEPFFYLCCGLMACCAACAAAVYVRAQRRRAAAAAGA